MLTEVPGKRANRRSGISLQSRVPGYRFRFPHRPPYITGPELISTARSDEFAESRSQRRDDEPIIV